MKAKAIKLTMMFILVAALLIWRGSAAEAASLCVNPGGTGGCFSTIQAAVDAAQPGQTIRVYAGTYAGGVIVDKSGLQVLAHGLAGTVKIVGPAVFSRIHAKGPAMPANSATVEKPDLRLMGLQPAFAFKGKGLDPTPPRFGLAIIANDVVIRGFEISGFVSGILVGGLFSGDTTNRANHSRIAGNLIHDNGYGIYLWQSNDNTIRVNSIYNNKDFDGVEGVGVLSFNGFGDAQVGAANTSGHSGKNNRILHNSIFNNDRLAVSAGACTELALGCQGPTGVHADISGTVIEFNNAYGNGADASLLGVNGTEAIGLLDAHGGTVRNNQVHDNAYHGIFVNYSDGADVNQNVAGDNSLNATDSSGIRVNNANGVGVTSNTTNRNGRGIRVTSSLSSSFRSNSAFRNMVVDLDWDGLGSLTFAKNKCGTANPSKAAWDCK